MLEEEKGEQDEMFNTILDNRQMLAESADRDQTTVFVGIVPDLRKNKESI